MKRIGTILLIVSAICAIGILGYSVLQSGINYQYDIDELSHVQYAYLIASGFKPYTDFFIRFTPLFALFEIPVLKVYGFNFMAIHMLRIVMVLLFILRLTLIAYIAKKIFNPIASFFAVILLLLDPFTIFSGMQIRPDQLMMTLFIFGLAVLVYGWNRLSPVILFVSGLLIGLSLLVLVKILPAAGVVGLFVLYKTLRKRNFASFGSFILGLLLPSLLFIFILFTSGLLQPAIQEILFDSSKLNKALQNQPFVGFYFLADNRLLFGFNGKPLTWIYTRVFPFLTVVGFFIMIAGQLLRRHSSRPVQTDLQLLILFMGLAQFLVLLKIPGVFVHYFLTLNWIQSMYGGFALSYPVNKLKRNQVLTWVYFGIVGFFLFAFIRESYYGNQNRSKINYQGTLEASEGLLNKIPADKTTFPNTLFRPISYPIAVGAFIGDIPKEILHRFGPIWETLEKKKVPYVLLSDYVMGFVDEPTQIYIKSHYMRTDENIWVRK